MVNILFLIGDALRSDHLHCYGYPKNTSPNIDKLASEGVLFKNVISHSNHTIPGLVSLFSGLYPTSHGIDSPKNLANWNLLWKGWVTPLDAFNKAGFVTAGPDLWAYSRFNYKIEVKNPLDFIDEHCSKNAEAPFFLWYRIEITHLPYNPSPPYDTMFLPKGYRISSAVKKRLDIVKSKSIIHGPGLISQVESGICNVIEPPDDEAKSKYPRTVGISTFSKEDKVPIVALYDGEVKTLDDLVGCYIKKLEEFNILEDTIIIFTSDHGEALLERGSVGHSSSSLAGTLYDENIKIPLIIRYPSLIPKGKIIDTQVAQADVMPTILDMLNLDYSGSMDGDSLIPLLEGKENKFVEETYSETLPCGWQTIKGDERRIWCIRTPLWKLIYYCNPSKSLENYYELFNLIDDPAEKINVINENADIFKKLRVKLETWMEKMISFDVV